MNDENLSYYTNDIYMNKKEVANSMGYSNFNNEKWTMILEYRNKYIKLLNFETNNEEWLYITQTPELINKEMIMIGELALLQSFIYKTLESSLVNSIDFKNIVNNNISKQIFSILNTNDEKKITLGTIKDIVSSKRQATNPMEEKAFSIYKALRTNEQEEVFPKEINKLVSWKTGKSFRDENISFENETNLSIEQIGCDQKDIKKINQNLEDTLSDTRTSLVLKMSINYFVTNYKVLFKEDNNLTSIIYIESIFKKAGFGNIVKFMNLPAIFHKNDSKLKESVEKAIDSKGDITFLYQTTIEIIRESIRQTYKTLDHSINQKHQGSKDSKFSNREVNLIAKEMMRKNPNITLKQAMFYAGHSNDGNFYTINDYREYNSSSYETSRYSMDNLVKNSFYIKEKIGKKFIYKTK